MRASSSPSFERAAAAAVALLLLAPVLAQGLWRPLAGAQVVDTLTLSYAALGVAATASLAQRLGSGRSLPIWLPGAAAVAVALPLGFALGGGAALAALVGVGIFSGALLPWLLAQLPAALDGLAKQRKGVAAALGLVCALAVVETARMSAFLGDGARGELSLVPDVPFLVHHSCLSAYVEGARLAAEGAPNLYADEHWPDLSGVARDSGAPSVYAPFNLDAYAYPPPFLLLPRALSLFASDFASQRAIWYLLNGLVAAFALWKVALWVGAGSGAADSGAKGRVRPLLLIPALWVSVPTLLSFQVGNAHLLVVAAVMLALVAFDTRRPALGGALLAFAIISKISPGLMVVVLLVQRRYREILWTAAFGLVYALMGLLVIGPAPYVQFLTYELPRLSSGAALTFLTGPDTVPINLAPFGIPFKLSALGLDVGEPWALARRIGQVYTLVLLMFTVLGARRARTPQASAELWAALMLLAALRSPLAASYVLFAVIWLLSLRSISVRGWASAVGIGVLWCYLSLLPPMPVMALTVYTLVLQVVVVGVGLYFLVWGPREDVAIA